MGAELFAVGLGGAIGAISRYIFASLLPSACLGLPLPIMIVNVVGCFAAGLIFELPTLTATPSKGLRLFLFPGFFGGLTTFSAFAYEFHAVAQKQDYGQAFIYGGCSVVLSLIAFWLGMHMARYFFT